MEGTRLSQNVFVQFTLNQNRLGYSIALSAMAYSDKQPTLGEEHRLLIKRTRQQQNRISKLISPLKRIDRNAWYKFIDLFNSQGTFGQLVF